MDGPERIRAAVEALGVSHIGHGTCAIHDLQVVNLLVRHQVVVEIGPSSSERLRNVPSSQAHLRSGSRRRWGSSLHDPLNGRSRRVGR
ncbi:hypothetical protein [Phormidium sp. CCY1219]|uniref:hypothetical protein n=1 Tax=Phormidium sp. CCY1219 TaxID=2886104 RepID=UPI002D1E7A40|nr:hypothetical protein [Phormidium sp. CCY1219]